MELSIEQARAFYPGNDPVHGFDHVMRVYRIAERLARDESADLEIVRTAALLHDSRGRIHAGRRMNAKCTICSARTLRELC